MNNPVPQRMLERLASGALDEEESAELMARLQQEPDGIERLEDLMEANEAFFERHPAEEVVPEIERRHGERQREQVREKRSTPRLVAVAAVVLLSIAAAYLLSRPEANEPEEQMIAASAVEPDLEEVAPDTLPDPVVAPELLEITDFDEIVLQNGESRRFDTHGLTRIVLEDESVVSNRVSAKGDYLTIEALEYGLTALQFFFDEDETHSAYVRVAAAYDPEHLGALREEGEAELLRCLGEQESGELDLRLTIGDLGNIMKIRTDRSTLRSAARDCVMEAVGNWDFQEITAERREIRVALLELEF